MSGDRIYLYAPRDCPELITWKHRTRSAYEDAIQSVTPETFQLDRSVKIDNSRQGWMIPGFTGRGINLDHPDLARPRFSEVWSLADTQFSIQPLARVALASLAVETAVLCSPPAALEFVLCDTVPGFVPMLHAEAVGYPALPAVFSIADPMLGVGEIGRLISERRSSEWSIVGHVTRQRRAKRPTEELNALVKFVDKRRPDPGRSTRNMQWDALLDEWLKAKGYPYPDTAAIRKAYSRAVKTREQKGLRPRKGGETQ